MQSFRHLFRRPDCFKTANIIIIAIADDYRFLIFGLSYFNWIFKGFFILIYGLLTLFFSCKTGLMESSNNGNNNGSFSNAVKKIHDVF